MSFGWRYGVHPKTSASNGVAKFQSGTKGPEYLTFLTLIKFRKCLYSLI
jgi:hypothetical protein